ncbi:MAG: methylenetetrahydrofolate reductase [Helicobacter sp.]|nr:methylenetetrahydrofolate reductase [Helicobacter sp.]
MLRQKNKGDIVVEDVVAKIQKRRFLSFEFVPATGGIEAQIAALQASGIMQKIDAIVCTDSPRACLKMSPILASIKLQQTLQKPVICTLSMRDRNSLALQAELLGANTFDLRLFLALTGDPVHLGDQPQSKGVFEGSSKLLLKIIDRLNCGTDLQGKPLKCAQQRIYPLCVMNAFAKPLEKLKAAIRNKIQNGICAIITQPVYERDTAQTLLQWVAEANHELGRNATLIFGFYPITTFKGACFLHKNLPGMSIPHFWLQKLESAHFAGKEHERAEGVRMSQELFAELWNLQQCVHFMSSSHLKIAKEILCENFCDSPQNLSKT